jgi:molybdenum cofactor guanylyltransferase
MMATHPCSCIILAGGESKRFNGSNKAFLEVGGKRVLDRLLAVVQPFFEEIILVAARPEIYIEWDLLIVRDHFNYRSSLTGIHAGLFAAGNPHALVVGCDMPFVQPSLLAHLLKAVEPRWDVVIPQTSKGKEPLMAIYSKRCLSFIEDNILCQKFQINRFFRQVRTKTIEEDQLRCHDSELISFFNINSPNELIQAEAWLDKQGALP